jgi:hypothetical protein
VYELADSGKAEKRFEVDRDVFKWVRVRRAPCFPPLNSVAAAVSCKETATLREHGRHHADVAYHLTCLCVYTNQLP